MPFRLPDQQRPHQGTRFFRRFAFGDLGDLSIVETRQNRSLQVTPRGCRRRVRPGVTPAIDGASPTRPPPARARAARWIKEAWPRQSAAGTSWATRSWSPSSTRAPPSGAGLTFNADQWDGYTADRSLLHHAAAHQPSRRRRRPHRRHPRVLGRVPARRAGPRQPPTRPPASSSSVPVSRATGSSRSCPDPAARRPAARGRRRHPAGHAAPSPSSTRGCATSTG